jgi:hypothetical protein
MSARRINFGMHVAGWKFTESTTAMMAEGRNGRDCTCNPKDINAALLGRLPLVGNQAHPTIWRFPAWLAEDSGRRFAVILNSRSLPGSTPMAWTWPLKAGLPDDAGGISWVDVLTTEVTENWRYAMAQPNSLNFLEN